MNAQTVGTEDEAAVLLFGREVLPPHEQALLGWLLDQPGRSSLWLADESGLGVGSDAFRQMSKRWRGYGFLDAVWVEEYETHAPRATDFAAMVMGMDAVEWVLYTVHGVEPVDLDAYAEEYELAAGEGVA
ncbi:hypothetical protein [Nocardia alba]|uniref:Uncharacterized protein n=1 Tax=Nocardia alba TaxID=225051 RepID=A0A4R1FMP1_9NOCA|nr:hypothetical protein [Nocardia alba]TCJ94609.1 hypothetical protein DFR71_5211 [Nocardia alba]